MSVFQSGHMATRDALEALLERSDGATRPARVLAAMRSLSLASAEAGILLAELLTEAAEQRYDLAMRTDRDRRFRSWAAAFGHLTGLGKRSVFRYLRLGRAIRAFPMAERNWLRDQLAPIGIDRAIALARVIAEYPTPIAVAPWVAKAASVSARECRRMAFAVVPAEGKHATEPCPTCRRPWRRATVPA